VERKGWVEIGEGGGSGGGGGRGGGRVGGEGGGKRGGGRGGKRGGAPQLTYLMAGPLHKQCLFHRAAPASLLTFRSAGSRTDDYPDFDIRVPHPRIAAARPSRMPAHRTGRRRLHARPLDRSRAVVVYLYHRWPGQSAGQPCTDEDPHSRDSTACPARSCCTCCLVPQGPGRASRCAHERSRREMSARTRPHLPP